MDHPRRVIVNQRLARQYFGGRDPIRRSVWLEKEREPYEVIGVAGDAKYQDVRLSAPPIVYLFAPMSRGSTDLSLRTSVRPTAIAADARRIVNDVFGTDAVGPVTTRAGREAPPQTVLSMILSMLAGQYMKPKLLTVCARSKDERPPFIG
jgi:hypothetical protein